ACHGVGDVDPRLSTGSAPGRILGVRGGPPRFADDHPVLVQPHPEHLAAADVDAEGDLVVGPPSVGHAEDSTRAFNSRNALATIRLWARILMKPGIGTRSSTSR